MEKWTQANGFKANYAQTVAFFVDLLEGLATMKAKEYVAESGSLERAAERSC